MYLVLVCKLLTCTGTVTLQYMYLVHEHVLMYIHEHVHYQVPGTGALPVQYIPGTVPGTVPVQVQYYQVCTHVYGVLYMNSKLQYM